jgi:hypothetical protein
MSSKRVPPMTTLAHFDRLMESVEMIARHVDYPGKHRVVDQCAEEIGELSRAGRITDSQEGLLLDILRTGHCRQRSA